MPFFDKVWSVEASKVQDELNKQKLIKIVFMTAIDLNGTTINIDELCEHIRNSVVLKDGKWKNQWRNI